MRGINFAITVLLSLLLVQCKSTQPVHISYTDQNNNRYTVTESVLKYDPITPAESSSGTFSGGDPLNIKITKNDFEAITNLAEEILSTESRDNKREMLTSVLTIKKGAESRTVILKKSKDRMNLEEMLQKLKQK